MLNRYNCVDALCRAGIAHTDAIALRRISITLHRWHELECGSSDDYKSYCLVRGDFKKAPERRAPRQPDGSRWPKEFVYDDNGRPHMETHYHDRNAAEYYRVGDRERGALKRLAAIMARYPGFTSYVQGDPRGCALYILHPNAIAGADAFSTDPAVRAEWLACNYSRGIAVCQ